jgi:hypothetical protein
MLLMFPLGAARAAVARAHCKRGGSSQSESNRASLANTYEVQDAAPKIDEVVCAHNFFRRKGTKPILQVTVTLTPIIGSISKLHYSL